MSAKTSPANDIHLYLAARGWERVSSCNVWRRVERTARVDGEGNPDGVSEKVVEQLNEPDALNQQIARDLPAILSTLNAQSKAATKADEQIADLEARLAALEADLSTPTPAAQPPPAKGKGR